MPETARVVSLLQFACIAFELSPSRSFLVAPSFHHRCATPKSRYFPHRLPMVSLNTAWEWLAEDRLKSGEELYQELEWIDPTSEGENHEVSDSSAAAAHHHQQETWDHIPLYPIPAVYLPVAGVNHTLNNVEPRNIQMAMDLMTADDAEKDKLFCLALRAADTGRIAKMGTLMQLLHAQPHYQGTDDDGSSISRIVVTCQALEPVTIDSIDNGPEAESRISKLMRSPLYLKASVSSQRQQLLATSSDDDDDILTANNGVQEKKIEQLISDYAFVRSMYVDGIGQEEVPMFARENLGNDLPDEWTTDAFSTDAAVWQVAYTWQSLCNTVREGRQLNLLADRNEIMIDAACQLGGPLKLPIHVEDLPPDVQRQVQQMEVDRQKEFAYDCKMDPVLDFLVLLQQKSLSDRINYLSRMVARERQRLTDMALNDGTKIVERTTETKEVEPQRKGAWFDQDF